MGNSKFHTCQLLPWLSIPVTHLTQAIQALSQSQQSLSLQWRKGYDKLHPCKTISQWQIPATYLIQSYSHVVISVRVTFITVTYKKCKLPTCKLLCKWSTPVMHLIPDYSYITTVQPAYVYDSDSWELTIYRPVSRCLNGQPQLLTGFRTILTLLQFKCTNLLLWLKRYSKYIISKEICTRFLLCCALLCLYIDWFSHIHLDYFTGTVAI